jgi:hypothetical protein
MAFLIAAAIIASGSVAAMAAGLISAAVWIVSPSTRGLARVAVLAGLIGALVASTVLSNQVTSPARRIAQVVGSPTTNPDAGSGQARIAVIEAAWPRIAHDPLIGTGLGNTNLVVNVITGGVNQTEQVHGAPLAAWYEAGILGLVGLLLVFGALAVTGWRASVSVARDADRLLGWTLVASFAAFTVYALTAPLFFQQYGWLAATLVTAWAAQVRAARVAARLHEGDLAEPAIASIRLVA